MRLTDEMLALEEAAKNLALTWWKRYFPGEVPDPVLLPEKLGFYLEDLDGLTNDKIDGMCRRGLDGSVGIFINPHKDSRRKNITIPHECAHPFLHPDQAEFHCYLRSSSAENDPMEWQATRCGAHFIMAEPLLLNTIACIRATQAQVCPSPEFDENDTCGPNGLAKWALTKLFRTYPASWSAIKWHLDVLNIQSSALTQKFFDQNIWLPWDASPPEKRSLRYTIREIKASDSQYLNEIYEEVAKSYAATLSNTMSVTVLGNKLTMAQGKVESKILTLSSRQEFTIPDIGENGRFVECPLCHNPDFSPIASHCTKCGTYLFNKCTNTSHCGHINTSKGEFCECCGAETTIRQLFRAMGRTVPILKGVK